MQRLLLTRQATTLASFPIFSSGTGSIQSATFTLDSPVAYFDFDGSFFLNNTFPPGIHGVEPVLGVLTGLSAADISFPLAAVDGVLGGCDGSYPGPCLGHPTTLTFTFAPLSFAPGDSFRFSADVDGTGGSGGSFGALGTSFSVLMSSGETFSAPFVTLSDNHSEAAIAIREEDAAAVPTPPTFPLFATGLGLLFVMAVRRRRLRSGLFFDDGDRQVSLRQPPPLVLFVALVASSSNAKML